MTFRVGQKVVLVDYKPPKYKGEVATIFRLDGNKGVLVKFESEVLGWTSCSYGPGGYWRTEIDKLKSVEIEMYEDPDYEKLWE